MKTIKEVIFSLQHLAISKTAISTYFVFSGNLLSAFLAFLATVVLVRNLSIADIGYFSALWSYLLLVSDVADIGIGSSLSTFLPPLQRAPKMLLRFLKTSFILQIIIALIVSNVLLILSSFFSNLFFHTSSLADLVRIITIAIFFSILSNFFQYSLAARQKFYSVALLSALGSFIRLALLILLIIGGIFTLHYALYAHILALFILAIVSVIFLGFEFLQEKFSRDDFKKLISFTYLLGIARGVTAIASRLDVIMIISLQGPVEAGIYAIASRIIAIYPLLAGSFSTVIAPKLSENKDIRIIKKFLAKVILATGGIIATIIFLVIFSNSFMTLLFSAKGIQAASVFQLLLFSMIFFVASIPVVSIAIYYLRKPNILTINSILQLFIVVVGNLVLIPVYGRFGAAFSLIIAYSVTLFTTTIMTFYYYTKHVH